MKVYKQVDLPAVPAVPPRTVEQFDKTVCDLCGNTIPPQDAYDVSAIEIRRRTGERYPEGGSGVDYEVDMCLDCWNNKLLPWLATFGAKPAEREWDF